MKRIALFVLTVLTVAALILTVSPVSVKADKGAFPTGTYATTITYDDIAKYGLPQIYHDILEGDWEMVFGEDGNMAVTNRSTGQSGQGAYSWNQTVLIFGKDWGELDCYSPAYAVYKWSLSGNILTLTAASENSDRCWGRFIVNTSHPFVKAP